MTIIRQWAITNSTRGDMRWGLRQVRKGMANSQIHAKQLPKYSKKDS